MTYKRKKSRPGDGPQSGVYLVADLANLLTAIEKAAERPEGRSGYNEGWQAGFDQAMHAIAFSLGLERCNTGRSETAIRPGLSNVWEDALPDDWRNK